MTSSVGTSNLSSKQVIQIDFYIRKFVIQDVLALSESAVGYAIVIVIVIYIL